MSLLLEPLSLQADDVLHQLAGEGVTDEGGEFLDFFEVGLLRKLLRPVEVARQILRDPRSMSFTTSNFA